VTRLSLGAAALALVLLAGRATAQTDYYNTSVGRPLRIEDASPVEYHAIEFDVAPLRFESARGGLNRWSLHPETAIGILPRTQVRVGVPLAYLDASGTSARGVAGVEISMLHALNAETSIPALAVAADVLLPVGPLGGDAAYGTLKGILTRTTPWARFHANAQVTVGPSETATTSQGSSSIAGNTDILITYTYKLAIASGKGNDYGLASAVSIIIFLIIAAISGFMFMRTKSLETLR